MDGPLLVARRELHLGPLLAEGGEGRVYELADRPDRVCKMYRVPQRRVGLTELVGWSTELVERSPSLASRVRASTSWPVAVVVDDRRGAAAGVGEVGLGKGDAPWAAGLVLPRAPRRFNVLHRDGRPHLASLSYLTADPDRRSAAYGIGLPAPMSPERLGLVYALARLLEVFEAGSPSVCHGDLSAKNVLWSLARGPEVFVLDCDNGERYQGGELLGAPDRRRAMTPNWDDPAVPAGANPGPASDRYSLALIFLRVCGAAHYPVQKLQKAGEAISLDVAIPPSLRRARALAAGAALWDLCARGLSATAPGGRPPAAAWVQELEAVIRELGATRVLDAVWASQGRVPVEVAPGGMAPTGAVGATGRGGRAVRPGDAGSAAVGLAGAGAGGPVPGGPVSGGPTPRDVTVQPVAARARVDAMIHRPALPAVPLDGAGEGWTATRTGAGGFAPRGRPGLPSPPGPGEARSAPAARPGPSAWAEVARILRSVAAWLVEEHRRTARDLRTAERRGRGVLRIAWCLSVDFVLACALLFVAAMMSSPFLGI